MSSADVSSGARSRPALWPLAIAAAATGIAAFQAWRTVAPRPPEPAARVDAVRVPAGPDCPAQHLPDDDAVCLPLPPAEDRTAAAAAPIELLPGRTPDYARYVTPIANYRAAAAPEGLGLFVAAPRGVPVTAVSLEAQSGQTRRWVTPTTPPRLLTLHRVDRNGSSRTYVLAYDGVAFDATPGLHEVAVGTPLGRVAGGGKTTGLALHVRQLRRGVEADNVSADQLLLDASSLPCDARNVLPVGPAR